MITLIVQKRKRIYEEEKINLEINKEILNEKRKKWVCTSSHKPSIFTNSGGFQ